MALFYAFAGALALVAALVIVRPLLRGRGEVTPDSDSDAALYRDQLAEIDRDLDRGTISADEAKGARAEVSRRLIAAAERAGRDAPPAPAPHRASRLLAVVAVIGAPAIALAIYLSQGMPGEPGQPFAQRDRLAAGPEVRPSQTEAEAANTTPPPSPQTEEAKDYAALIARLETLIEQRPGDAQGLALLATGYMRLGRYAESWRAYKRLIEAQGSAATAETYANMAEAMVLAAAGYVSPEAEEAIGEALARDPSLPAARYYGGLLAAQSGRVAEAVATWEQLKAEAPADAPWLPFLDTMLAEARSLDARTRGPSAADVEAAAQMSPEERQQMIEGMVAGLESRLTADGGPVEDWLRLITAYDRLGRREDAARIARLGIAAFGSGTEADFLREQALIMGVISE